jgi:hypothetical protein
MNWTIMLIIFDWFLYLVAIHSQKHRKMLKFFIFHILFIAYLAQFSYGWATLWLHHKIDPKTPLRHHPRSESLLYLTGLFAVLEAKRRALFRQNSATVVIFFMMTKRSFSGILVRRFFLKIWKSPDFYTVPVG